MKLFKWKIIPLLIHTNSTIRPAASVDESDLGMYLLFVTTLLFLQEPLLTSWACPMLNGDNNSTCEECSVYDYVIYETSNTPMATMVLNVNITTNKITNDRSEFRNVLIHNSPAFYGRHDHYKSTVLLQKGCRYI